MLNENLTEENNNKPVQQEAFCCISLFVLVKIARSLIDNSNQIYGGQSINICTHEKEERQ